MFALKSIDKIQIKKINRVDCLPQIHLNEIACRFKRPIDKIREYIICQINTYHSRGILELRIYSAH